MDTVSLDDLSCLAHDMREQMGRDWHTREQLRSVMHPAVVAAFELAPADDWHNVVIEWPHRSLEDNQRLAYTQNERKGAADIQTVTTVGKYLARHFPTLADHVIRGLAARFNATGCEIHKTAEWILRGVQEGPKSCMQWNEDDIRIRGGHPYEAYSPAFGWGMAVRVSEGSIVGRALVLEDDSGKSFVRTYMQQPGCSGYSQRDEELEQYLMSNGYTHRTAWPDGTRLAKLTRGHRGYLLPYIDGNTQNITDIGSHFEVSENGEYECSNTCGTADEAESMTCEDCNDRMSDDDSVYLGDYLDRTVCNCCAEDYTLVLGRRRNEYYVRDRDAVECDGQDYHHEYIGDNDIVELDNGDYCSVDDCFYCEISGGSYHYEDGRTVEDVEGMVHVDNAWQCTTSDKWYSDNEEYVLDADGNKHHPDNYTDEVQEELELSVVMA